jgi:hypothetical protein
MTPYRRRLAQRTQLQATRRCSCAPAGRLPSCETAGHDEAVMQMGVAISWKWGKSQGSPGSKGASSPRPSSEHQRWKTHARSHGVVQRPREHCSDRRRDWGGWQWTRARGAEGRQPVHQHGSLQRRRRDEEGELCATAQDAKYMLQRCGATVVLLLTCDLCRTVASHSAPRRPLQ